MAHHEISCVTCSRMYVDTPVSILRLIADIHSLENFVPNLLPDDIILNSLHPPFRSLNELPFSLFKRFLQTQVLVAGRERRLEWMEAEWKSFWYFYRDNHFKQSGNVFRANIGDFYVYEYLRNPYLSYLQTYLSFYEIVSLSTRYVCAVIEC